MVLPHQPGLATYVRCQYAHNTLNICVHNGYTHFPILKPMNIYLSIQRTCTTHHLIPTLINSLKLEAGLFKGEVEWSSCPGLLFPFNLSVPLCKIHNNRKVITSIKLLKLSSIAPITYRRMICVYIYGFFVFPLTEMNIGNC